MKTPGKRASAGKISEFGIAMYIVLLLAVFPLLDLLWLIASYGVVVLAAHQFASAASVEPNYKSGLESTFNTACRFSASGWARFARLSPMSGYDGCGCDLYVQSTAIVGQDVSQYGPNTPPPPPIVSDRIWEYKALVQYEWRPPISLSAVPIVGSIPGLGRPVRITHAALRAAEHPEGLAEVNDIQFQRQPTGSILASFPPGVGGGETAPEHMSWNYPNIYVLIAAAGQVIVDEDVLEVDSRNADWTDTGLSVSDGQKAWIDTRADGQWRLSATSVYVDANGYTSSPVPGDGLIPGKLIGRLGTNPSFEVGRFQLNMVPNGQGKLLLMCHDMFFDDNDGKQVVRVIVTQSQ